MRRGRARVGLGVVTLACVLAGIGLLAGWPSSAPPPELGGAPGQAVPSPQADGAGATKVAAVRQLLAHRGEAVLHRDRKAFLATIDPKATEAFHAEQARQFDNLAGVPLDQWAYTINPDDTVSPAKLHPPDPAELTGAADHADELWAPRTDLEYALRGVDSLATSQPMGFLYVRRGGHWYVRSDTALDDTDRKTWRGPWDFAPCKERTTERGFVLYHPGDEDMAQRLANELDSAVRAVSDVWGTQWSRRVAMVLPATATEMRAEVGPDFPIQSVVAVSVADEVNRDTHTVRGQRVVFSPTGSRGLSPTALRVVVRHEFTHIAARVDSVDGTPTWVLEGFADYVGYRTSGVTLAQGAPDLAKVVGRGATPGAMPADADFRSGGQRLDLAYQKAWTMMRYIGQHYGEAKLVTLYRALAGTGAQPAAQLDQQLRGLLGVDQAGLVRAWQDYLRTALG